MAAPTFTPLPTPPSRAGMTGTAFSNATDAFLAAWATLQTEGDALGVFCETQADAALSAAVAGNLAALDLTALAGWVIGVNAGGTALEGVELIAPAQATETAAGVAELATTAEAQAGTDDLAMMTSLKVKAAIASNLTSAESLTANGYITLANGLIVQWGLETAPAGAVSAAISFPIPFPTAVFVGFANKNTGDAGATNANTVGFLSDTLSTFKVYSDDNSKPVYWLALGI